MTNSNFERQIHEANRYFNLLAEKLNHPEEQQRAFIIWRAVMHTLRDRMAISESLDLISQLPVILKGYYVDQWSYSETPPETYDTIEGMKNKVKNLQDRYGETDFDWKQPTEKIISITINSLREYLSEGQLQHIRAQMPAEVKELVG